MPNADTHMPRTLQEDNTELVRTDCPCSPTPLHHAVFPTRARSESRSALLRRRTSLRASSPDTPPRVRIAFEQTKTRTHTHTHTHTHASLRFLTLCTDLDTKGIHEVRPRLLDSLCHTLSRTHAHTSTDTHALRRRSPRAASAWSPRITRLCPLSQKMRKSSSAHAPARTPPYSPSSEMFHRSSPSHSVLAQDGRDFGTLVAIEPLASFVCLRLPSFVCLRFPSSLVDDARGSGASTSHTLEPL